MKLNVIIFLFIALLGAVNYGLNRKIGELEMRLKTHDHYTGFEEYDIWMGTHYRAFEARYGSPFRSKSYPLPREPGFEWAWSGALAPDFKADLEQRNYRNGDVGYLVLIDVRSGAIVAMNKLIPGCGDYDLLEF